MAFFAQFNHYMLRTNINVAIVAMVNASGEEELTSNTSSSTCPPRSSANTSNVAEVRKTYHFQNYRG